MTGRHLDLRRVETLIELRRYPEAELGLRGLLADDPDNTEAMILLADVLEELGRSGEGVQVARAAVSAAPDDPRAHRVLCHLLLRESRPAEAVEAAEVAVRLAPWDWTTHYTLGLALRSGRRPRARDALACANEAVRLAPHASHAHNLAGLCLDDLRLHDEAQRAYAEALRLDPQNTMALNNLAALNLGSGKLSRASAFLTAGLSTDAQERALHQNYDAILVKLLWRLSLVGLGLALLVAILAGTGAPWVAKAALGALLLPTYALVGRGVTRALPRGVQHWARGLFGRSGWGQRILIALFVLTSAAVLVMAFGTHGTTLAVGMALLVVLRTLGVVVIVVGLGRLLVDGVRRLRRD